MFEKMKRLSLRITLLIVALCSTLSAWAQVSFKAEAPALTAKDQPFRVEFSVNEQPDDGTFRAPSFEGFDILAGPSVSTGHSVQWINGRQSSSYTCTYTYVLMPTTEGTFTIGAATLSVDGKSYTTEPFPIEIIAERAERGREESTTEHRSPESRIGKDDVLIRLKISDSDVYKGESIRASLVLYTRINIDQVENVELPQFNDFWSQELSFDNAPSREEYNGRIYETYKIAEYMLSPQRSGKIDIEPAKMNIIAQVVVQDSRSMDPIFGGRQIYHVRRELTTPAISINVKEFPAGAPSSFNGAVGQFTMRSTMPEESIMANSAE